MKSPRSRKILLLVVSMAFIPSCQLSKRFRNLFYSDQLETFHAKNSHYFPEFIDRFFSNVQRFSKDYPSIELARAQIKLIEVKPLSKIPKNRVNESNLSWSADGAYLGYEIVAGHKRHIRVKNLIGDFSRELAVIPKKRQNFLNGMISKGVISYNAGLKWANNSIRYAFMSNGGIGEYNIYVGSIGEKEQSIARSPTKDGYATWNPNGNELAFVSARSGNGDIYSVDLKSKKTTRLTFSDQIDLFPEWFRNGKRIVFSSGSSFNHDLWVIDRMEGDNRWHKPFPLTRWHADELKPIVSPDGKLIAFYGSEQSHNPHQDIKWNLHVIRFREGKTYGPATLKQTIVARNVVVDINSGAAWSPDSKKIFFVKNDAMQFNPIHGYNLYTGRLYEFKTGTKMNRDLMISQLGILSFRAQNGVWDKVYLALTNQGMQLQGHKGTKNGKIHYLDN